MNVVCSLRSTLGVDAEPLSGVIQTKQLLGFDPWFDFNLTITSYCPLLIITYEEVSESEVAHINFNNSAMVTPIIGTN